MREAKTVSYEGGLIGVPIFLGVDCLRELGIESEPEAVKFWIEDQMLHLEAKDDS